MFCYFFAYDICILVDTPDTLKLMFLFLSQYMCTYVVGIQKNHSLETILLSTQNMFILMDKKKITIFLLVKHKLWKSWKTWKITKKSSMHGKIMEFEKKTD